MNNHHHTHHHSQQQADIKMLLFTGAADLRSNEKTQLVFKPVNLHHPDETVILATQHEADFHLIILNEDLTRFAHIHPRLLPDGTYLVEHTFPTGGNYLLFADFQPAGHAPVTEKILVQVIGMPPADRVPAPEEKLHTAVNGLSVSIAASSYFRSGTEAHLPIKIEQRGNALQSEDISPYLGAVAHIIVVGKADKDFLHIHPEAGTDYPIIGHTTFPKPGIYRLWVQFKTGETLHTADFTVNVL